MQPNIQTSTPPVMPSMNPQAPAAPIRFGLGVPKAPPMAPAPAPAPMRQPMPAQVPGYHVADRGVTLTDADLGVLKPILFGEISNRPIDKKELEARVITNTVLNRAKQYASNGQQKSVADILAMPNQYQAYNGSQFHNYNNPNLDAPSAEKKKQVEQVVDKILQEIKAGTFSDNTNGAVFYKHGSGSTIQYDDTRKLFKGSLGQAAANTK